MAIASVKVSASASSYKAEIKSAAAVTKELTSEYNLAAAQAKLFGRASDELKARVEMLTKKVDVQKGVVETNGKEQERLAKRLENQKTRHEQLTAKIKDAERAYEAEKEATGKNSEETKKLKAELDKLNDELKQNEKNIKNSETALTNQKAKTNEAKAKLAELEKELKDVNKELNTHGWDEFGKGCEKVGSKIQDVGKKLSILSGAVATAGGTSAKMSMDFEDSFAKVTTIMDEGAMSTDDMKAAIMDLSNETGIAATDIAEDVYNAISAGQETGDAVNFLSTSTKLATAGFAESGQTLDLLTTILNAYGLEAEQVTDVSDMLIQTQNLGKTTVAELSSNMGKVIPTANANGVALDQLCTSYAIMTANGVATAESTTYINSMLNELGKTGSTTDQILREKTGKSFGELMQSGSSLSDVLNIVKDSAKEQNLSLGDMFSSSEAAKAGLILLGDDASVFNGKLAEMQNSSGMVDGAFEKMQTSSYDVKKALNELKNTAIDLGSSVMEVAAPIIEEVSGKIHELHEWFTGLDDDQKQMIVKIGGVVAAIGPLMVAGGSLIKGVKSVIDVGKSVGGVFGKVGGVLAGLSPTVLIVVGVIAALVAIGVLLYQNWDTIKEWAGKLWEGIKEAFDGIKDAITGAFDTAKEFVTNAVEGIQKNVSEKFDAAKEAVSNKVNDIKNTASNVFTAVKDKATSLMETAKNNVSAKLDAMKAAYNEKGGGIKGVANVVFTGIKDGIDSKMQLINTLTGGKLDSIKSAFSNKLNAAKSTVSSVMDGIKSAFSSKMDGARNAVSGAIDKIKGFFNFSWSLPKLKMPHPKISGKFSLNPPQVPSFSIDWYKTGAIMNQPTIFGMSGNTLLAGGEPETGGEAILPLAPFYTRLNAMLDKKLEAVQRMQTIYVENYTYIDSEEIANKTVTKVDGELVQNKRRRR